MNKRIAICILVIAGCAGKPSVPRALDAANKALAGVAIGVEYSETLVDEATNLMMDLCEAQPKGDGRRKCMGQLGKPVAPAYDELGDAYDAAVEAIKALKRAYEQLQPFVEAAKEVTER